MNKKELRLKKDPENILIISMRYLGDLLLTTPLIRTFKNAYPNANIDVLVSTHTAGMLEGNPDIRAIIHAVPYPQYRDYKELLKKIYRKYDLSVTTQAGDRPFIYSLLASSKRIGFIPAVTEKGRWKRFFMQGWSEFNNLDSHTVLEFLKLPRLLGLEPSYRLIPPTPLVPNSLIRLNIPDNYAVLHIHPQWTYKQWHDQGWQEVCEYLNSQGINIILSGGPSQEELEHLQQFENQLTFDVLNLAGKLSLAELSQVISDAELFIGPDTGITHLAAATGIPVIALFGPTNPVKWAPWPQNYKQQENPFQLIGSQKVNNVALVQGSVECVPCDLEGCDRHRQSYSRCLSQLPSKLVINHIKQVLN